jgi:hypothetical protein
MQFGTIPTEEGIGPQRSLTTSASPAGRCVVNRVNGEALHLHHAEDGCLLKTTTAAANLTSSPIRIRLQP